MNKLNRKPNRKLNRIIVGLMILLSMILPKLSTADDLVISNAYVVNVTPSSFSIFYRVSETADHEIEIYANPGGTSNLIGQLGIEQLYLTTGDPDSTNSFENRSSRRTLQSAVEAKNLNLIRVTGCQPDTPYYVRVSVSTNASGTITWPPSGLATARTAVANSFVIDSRQLLVDVPGDAVMGSVGILQHTNATYPLAAVVGDAASDSQLYFNLSDLFSASGGTNLIFSGEETFLITVYGSMYDDDLQRDYAMAMDTNTVVALANELIADAEYLFVNLGETNVLSDVGSSHVPISLISSPLATNISILVTMDTSVFTNLSIIPQVPEVGDASITSLGGDQYRITLDAASGQTIFNTTLDETTVAHLNFEPDPDALTLYVPLDITALTLYDQTNQLASPGIADDGSILVIGRTPYVEWVGASVPPQSINLYGIPGTNYQVEISSDLLSGLWSNSYPVSMSSTSLSMIVDLPYTNTGTLFIRIREDD